MIVKETNRSFSGEGHRPIPADQSFLFPLQSNLDTIHHLALLDPDNLQLKCSYAMPEISSLASDPSSSRVFICIYHSFLFELDVKTNRLRRLKYRPIQFANVTMATEKTLLFSHNAEGTLTSFDLNSPNLEKSQELKGIANGSTSSQGGKYVAVNTGTEYQFFVSDDLARPLASIPGPNLGMACVDDISNSALIAGIDSNSNITARLLQKNLDLTIVLGQGKYQPTYPENIRSISIAPIYSQLSEAVERGTLPASWQTERSPFYLSSIPHGKGFLLFTFEGAYVIEPLKHETQFSLGQTETTLVDVSSRLIDKTLRMAPVSSKTAMQLSSIDSPVGQVFGLPQGFVITDTHVSPDSGDLYITAFYDSKTVSEQNGNWVIRVERDQLSKSENITTSATKLFPGKPNQYVKTSQVEYGGRNCLAVSLHSTVWFLDLTTLEPVNFETLPNPLDLEQPPYNTALELDPDTNYYIYVNNATRDEQSTLVIGYWKEYRQWASGIFVNTQTGAVEGSVPLEDVALLQDDGSSTRQRIFDPYKQLYLFENVVKKNSVQQKLEFAPRLIMKTSPWIVGQKDENLLFLSRYDLSEKHTFPLNTSLHFSFPAHNRLISESELDNCLIISGPCASHLKDKVGNVIWRLPLMQTNLPQRITLATDFTAPTFNKPGEILSIPLKGYNPNMEIKLARAPQGVTFENNTLHWIPTRDDVGLQDIEFELTHQADKVIEKHRILVTPTLLYCGFAPRHIRLSNDGNYLAASADINLVIIDTVHSEIISSCSFEQNAIDNSFVGDSLLVMFENDNYSIISITNPEQRKNRTLPNQPTAHRGLPYVLRDKHLLLLAENPFKFLPLPIVSFARNIPDLDESPLNKYVQHPFNAFGYFPESNEILLGGVVLDENEQVTNVVSLEWCGIFCGNSSMYSIGIDGRHMTSSRATYITERNLTLPDNSFFRMDVRAIQEPGYQAIEWYHEITPGSNVFERFIVPTSYQIKEHMWPEAALLGDKLYFTAGSYYSTIDIPASVQASSAKPANPLRIKPIEPITILNASTKDIEFEIEGGTGPYNIDLSEKWHLYTEAIENTKNNDRNFYQVSMEGNKVSLRIDGAALVESLIEKPDQWFMPSKFRITENKDINELASELEDYRDRANESLADIAESRFKGVPLGLSLVLNVSDSDLQNAALEHFVIIDFPAAQYSKLFRENLDKKKRTSPFLDERP